MHEYYPDRRVTGDTLADVLCTGSVSHYGSDRDAPDTVRRPPRACSSTNRSAVTRRVFRCDGHAYEHMIEYDLAEAFDRLAYERKLDTFIEGFREGSRQRGRPRVRRSRQRAPCVPTG